MSIFVGIIGASAAISVLIAVYDAAKAPVTKTRTAGFYWVVALENALVAGIAAYLLVQR